MILLTHIKSKLFSLVNVWVGDSRNNVKVVTSFSRQLDIT